MKNSPLEHLPSNSRLELDSLNPRLKSLLGRSALDYAHTVAAVNGWQPDTWLSIRQRPFAPDDDPKSWQVVVHDLPTQTSNELMVVRSSLDAARHLWLQIADVDDVDSWPPGTHPSYHQLPYDQDRLEADLNPDYTTAVVTRRIGRSASHQLHSL